MVSCGMRRDTSNKSALKYTGLLKHKQSWNQQRAFLFFCCRVCVCRTIGHVEAAILLYVDERQAPGAERAREHPQ
jgi:hypothetical protein